MIVEIVVYQHGGLETPQYEGWQVLESEEKTVKGEKRIYIKSIVHAGAPENFVYYINQYADACRAEYILSNGKTKNSNLTSNIPTKTRNWEKYKDQSKLSLIDDVHVMTFAEAYKLPGNKARCTGAYYWLGTSYSAEYLRIVMEDGQIDIGDRRKCLGVRPVVSLTSGVYIKAGTGTDSDPYILGKDE